MLEENTLNSVRQGQRITEGWANALVRQVNALTREINRLNGRNEEIARLEMVPVKIGSALASGRYQATEANYDTGFSILATADELLNEEYFTSGGSPCILVHPPEVAIDTQRGVLKSDQIVLARYGGRGADGLNRFIFSGLPIGETASPTTFSPSGATAETSTWSRAANGTPVSITYQTRTFWDSTADILYGFSRTRIYDSCGMLISISAETRYTVDTPTAC